MIPELEYKKKYKPDYTGMCLSTECYSEMEDFSGTTRSYELDIIIREKDNRKNKPVVLFIHGGGFIEPSDKRQSYISTIARDLTKEGYAVVSPDYPVFHDKAMCDAAGGEVAAYARAGKAIHLAYRYLTANAQRLGLDTSRVAIIGGSAGGMTAFYAIADYNDEYRAFVNCWGAPLIIPDLSRFPPTLSIHGTNDQLVAYERELPVQEKLTAANIPHQLLTLEGENHTPLGKYHVFLPEIQKLLRKNM
jgi:acetyl esterase/lipase